MRDQDEQTSLETFTITAGEPPYRIEGRVIVCGRDVVVVVGGGTKYHTGAVAAAISLPSLKDPAKNTTTASTLSIPGHKEDQIAREAALRLARTLETTVTVAVGIHVDDASPDEIRLMVGNFSALINEIMKRLEDQASEKR